MEVRQHHGPRDLANAHILVAEDADSCGDPAHALQHFERAIECDPTFAFAYVKLGVALGTQGKTMEGIQVISRAVQIEPADNLTWLILGKVHEEAGDLKGAIDTYRRGIDTVLLAATGPDRRKERRTLGLRVALGRALKASGDPGSAQAEWKRVAATDLKGSAGDLARKLLTSCPE